MRPESRNRSREAGFTLIEILVVIAVIAILVGILLPVFFKTRKNARKTVCQSNLRQVGAAFNMYAQDFDEAYPRDWFMAPYGQVQWPGQIFAYLKDARLLTCPTGAYPELEGAGPGSQLAAPQEVFRLNYGCNEVVSGFPMSDIENPSEIVLVGDTGPNHLWITNPSHLNNYEHPQRSGPYWGMASPGRVAYRHNKAAYFVFCDGHAALVKWRMRCTQACPCYMRAGTRYQYWCAAGSQTMDGTYQDIFPALQQDACGSYLAPGARPPEVEPD